MQFDRNRCRSTRCEREGATSSIDGHNLCKCCICHNLAQRSHRALKFRHADPAILRRGQGFRGQSTVKKKPSGSDPKGPHQRPQPALVLSHLDRPGAAPSSCKTAMVCGDGSFCEWSTAPTSRSLFIRGLKFAAVTADWNENGFSGSGHLGLAGVDLTDNISLLGQQLHQVIRRKGIKTSGLGPDLLGVAYKIKDK